MCLVARTRTLGSISAATTTLLRTRKAQSTCARSFFLFSFFFLDSNFKILSQTMMSRTQASNTDGWKPGNSAGVHFFSASAEGPWTASQEAVYCGDVTLTNGSKAHLYVQPPLLRPRIRISQPTAHFLLLVCHCSLAFEN